MRRRELLKRWECPIGCLVIDQDDYVGGGKGVFIRAENGFGSEDLATLNEIRAHLDKLAVEVFGEQPGFDLIAHLHRQRAFSEKAFGPGSRLKGVLDHIRRELAEVEAAPNDPSEWADLILLALDGAWRSGLDPEQVAAAIEAKQTKNEGRTWPDWRTQDPEKAICHINAAPAEDGKTE